MAVFELLLEPRIRNADVLNRDTYVAGTQVGNSHGLRWDKVGGHLPVATTHLPDVG